MNALIVVHAFDDYRRGDVITDPAEVATVLKTRRHQVAINTTYIAITEAEKAKAKAAEAEPEPAPTAAVHEPANDA